jgi:hypothetical protein
MKSTLCSLMMSTLRLEVSREPIMPVSTDDDDRIRRSGFEGIEFHAHLLSFGGDPANCYNASGRFVVATSELVRTPFFG